MRVMHEKAAWRDSCFVTLTYDEASLPKDNSLDKTEFTKFWKRLRKSLGERKLRYYGCGEYGETFGRPHYHAIIFGVSVAERGMVERAWGHGRVHSGTVTKESARYTADYVGKALKEQRGAKAYAVMTGKAYGGRTPPFAVMSQGLGRQYADENAHVMQAYGLTVDGRRVRTPSYYWTRFARKEVKVQEDLTVVEGKPGERPMTEDELALWIKQGDEVTLEQRDRNLRARLGLRRKGSM